MFLNASCFVFDLTIFSNKSNPKSNQLLLIDVIKVKKNISNEYS